MDHRMQLQSFSANLRVGLHRPKTSKQVINMFKQTIATSLIALAIGSSSAWAANDASSVINIKASIPTQEFHAMPVNPEFGKDETMSYDPVKGTLSTLRQTFNVKNTTGSIHAYVDGGPPNLFNGNTLQNIPLVTTFNGVTLTANALLVVADGTATTAGTQADLVISAGAAPSGASGDYTASVTVIFDNVPKTL